MGSNHILTGFLKQLLKTLASNDFVDETGVEPHHRDVAKAEHRCIRRRGSSENNVHCISSSICVICLDSYHEGDEVIWSNNSDHCTHCLHLECALDYFVYLRDDSHPCPVCRQTFILPPRDVDTAMTTGIEQQEEGMCDVTPQGNRDDDLPV